MPTATATIPVKVQDPALRDRQLEQATSLLREKAFDCGILVTRVNYTTYALALSAESLTAKPGKPICCEG